MIHTVKVAKVTNPVTGNIATASFEELSNTVFISQDEIYFESEGYHLEGWCDKNGYELEIKTFDLEV